MRNKSSHINRVLKSIGIVLLLLICNAMAYGQTEGDSYLKDFKARYENEKIYLSWTTMAGFMCQDIRIQLTSDTTTAFETVATIYGVCGSEEKEENYFYVINSPHLNEQNYLRLELGSFGYSTRISVFALAPINQVVITPHPISSRSYIQLENKTKEELSIRFFTPTGKLISELFFNDNSILIDADSFPSGTIIYQIQGNELGVIRGKLICQP